MSQTNQWGFYFNQDRCLGCLTCKMACKNWNERRRGDAHFNVRDMEDFQVQEGEYEQESVYLDEHTGANNYQEFRKYYAKEDWRRVETYEYGSSLLDSLTNTFDVTVDRRYLSVSCNHCDNPSCVKACPVGIISKEPKYGAVITSFTGCISCGKCQEACPWSAPQFYDLDYARYDIHDPKRPMMTKCTLCVDRVEEGLKPACVAACWNRALDAGPIAELRARYITAVTEIREFASSVIMGMDTRPNILFKKKVDRK